ncbi:MAG: 50S ribosome-binding GTPase [Candidatus Lokiarchaeota archaeon]|nr:50S ribosome-binding GTPase [Candidatus Lokiarchaeota archaeon]
MSEKVEDRIKELEERLATTIPNKSTQRSINYIKAQLAKLRESLIQIVSSKKGGGGGFGIKKSGDAQVAFIGFPSVGKSSLLNLLTEGNTHSKVAAYDFTTTTAIPGMMNIEDAKIQLIDLPGIILGAAAGKGRGKEVLGAVRSAELILIIICFREDGTINFLDLKKIRNELYNAGIRLNSQPPRIFIKEQTRGGVHFTSKSPQLMDKNEVKALLNELGLRNAGVHFSEPNTTPDQLIDFIMGNRVYTKEFVVINKVDLMKNPLSPEEITESIGHNHWVMISAKNQENINALRHGIFQELNLIRVYLKPPKKEADMDEPIILHKGDTMKTLCRKIHKRFVKDFRFSLIWGNSARHPGQKIANLNHIIEDGDIISIYIKIGANN